MDEVSNVIQDKIDVTEGMGVKYNSLEELINGLSNDINKVVEAAKLESKRLSDDLDRRSLIEANLQVKLADVDMPGIQQYLDMAVKEPTFAEFVSTPNEYSEPGKILEKWQSHILKICENQNANIAGEFDFGYVERLMKPLQEELDKISKLIQSNTEVLDRLEETRNTAAAMSGIRVDERAGYAFESLADDIVKVVKQPDEYYEGYKDIKDDAERERLNSNDTAVLHQLYKNSLKAKKDARYCSYISDRVKKLQKIDSAAREAAMNGGIRPQAQPEIDGDNIKIPGIPNGVIQTADNGCWSVALSLMLGHRGVKLDQNDIRGFRPDKEAFGQDDVNEANGDNPMEITSYVDMVNRVAPNTAVNVIEEDADDIGTAKDKLETMIRRGLGKDNSPIAIYTGGHYRTITAIEDGRIHMSDSLRNHEVVMTVDELADRLYKNNKYVIKAQWLADIEVDKNRKPVIKDDNLKRSMENTNIIARDAENRLEADQFNGYTYTTGEGIRLTTYIPNKLYNADDLKKYADNAKKEDEARKNVQKRISDYEEWEKSRNTLFRKADDIAGRNIAGYSAAQLTAYNREVNALKEQLEDCKNRKPGLAWINEAEKYMEPFKTSRIRLNIAAFDKDYNDNINKLDGGMKKSRNARYLGRVQQAKNPEALRKEIVEAYEVLVGTKNRGTGSHERFANMLNGLAYYAADVVADNNIDKVTDKVKKKEIENVYECCAAYLKSHMEKDSKGNVTIDGQHTTDGAIRKQAVVQILINMQYLKEFDDVREMVENRKPNTPGMNINSKNVQLKLTRPIKAALNMSLMENTKSKKYGLHGAYKDLEEAKGRIKAKKNAARIGE